MLPHHQGKHLAEEAARKHNEKVQLAKTKANKEVAVAKEKTEAEKLEKESKAAEIQSKASQRILTADLAVGVQESKLQVRAGKLHACNRSCFLHLQVRAGKKHETAKAPMHFFFSLSLHLPDKGRRKGESPQQG